ncbi:hypothetical protein BJV85_002727 [Clostridium acetobutylicum]|uniref:Uncharacterized protein n=2 Tax=Bacteria TaxID=2 RepID=Q97JK4_CLOAB|nr:MULTISPECIES: hypothetical protein [Clostridium]AAK79241.1 Hypothetical protein CA_C1270 [Clostridium acetobutylicum ATCC 824]ADZ20321.1 Conserved hypothetical protein [Clostridium acetobutylicum EA 2018]AEI31743.1 hypothetical protein SMB_G1291 [Clostridium acetobutylicum DSM 1731]AWV81510.1 hypothetical protein DK921_15695 [Clostridium acetobutylicum]MBC2393148.1 hypothetical protein [Clostridium acetobutylicum]
MFDSVYETFISKDDNRVCLDIPKNDFLFSYEDITKDTAKDFVNNYFREKGREGIPNVTDVSIESDVIRLYIKIDYSESQKPMNVPDSLNMRGYDHNRTR